MTSSTQQLELKFHIKNQSGRFLISTRFVVEMLHTNGKKQKKKLSHLICSYDSV